MFFFFFHVYYIYKYIKENVFLVLVGVTLLLSNIDSLSVSLLLLFVSLQVISLFRGSLLRFVTCNPTCIGHHHDLNKETKREKIMVIMSACTFLYFFSRPFQCQLCHSYWRVDKLARLVIDYFAPISLPRVFLCQDQSRSIGYESCSCAAEIFE